MSLRNLCELNERNNMTTVMLLLLGCGMRSYVVKANGNR